MLRLVVMMISSSSLKLGHQAKSKENFVNYLEITFEVIIMNLAQNVCLDSRSGSELDHL